MKTRQFPIIEKGIFVGYQTIRDQAHLIGQSESMGCCYADNYSSVPFQRMPNVWLEPAKTEVSLKELIAGVEDGVLIDGRGSYSIDQQRYNFQFGGDAFWEIKNGEVGPMVADVGPTSRGRPTSGRPATGSAARRSGRTSASAPTARGSRGRSTP